MDTNGVEGVGGRLPGTEGVSQSVKGTAQGTELMGLKWRGKVTDGGGTCSERSMTYRDAESLCCTPETTITCVSLYFSEKKGKYLLDRS